MRDASETPPGRPASDQDPYDLVLSASARRALSVHLPLEAAFAAFELVDGPLRRRPRTVGAPLSALFEGFWRARRGEHRTRYRIDDRRRLVEVVSVDHRRHARRPAATDGARAVLVAAPAGDDGAMSVPPSNGPSSSGHLPQQAGAAPPPAPVRTAIRLVWVQVAIGALTTLCLVFVPGLREQVLAPARTTPGVPPGFERVALLIVVVSAAVGLLFGVAYAVVVTVFLRRGHRWVRTLVLVLASLAVVSLVTIVLQAAIYAVAGPTLLVPSAPLPIAVASGVVGAALYVAVVVLLFRPASRRWLDERTAQRRWDAQQQ